MTTPLDDEKSNASPASNLRDASAVVTDFADSRPSINVTKTLQTNLQNSDSSSHDGSARYHSALKRDWWNEWKQLDASIVPRKEYDSSLDALERMYIVAVEFRRSRRWPPRPTGVSNLWDQFRLYAGLLGTTPVWHMKGERYNTASSDSDEDEAGPQRPNKYQQLRPRPPYSSYGKDPIEVTSEEEIKALIENQRIERLKKLAIFLGDIATGIQIFLSSYIQDQGLIYAPNNLRYIPQILLSFMTFLQKQNALPDSRKDIARALEITEVALKELPLTTKLTQAMPDEVSMALTECFGAQAESFRCPKELTNPPQVPSEESSKIDEPRVQLVDLNMDFIPMTNNISVSEIQKEILEDNVDDPELLDSWGSTEPSSMAAWASPTHFLMSLLGPTPLPLTHTTGIVEKSTRRIKEISLPAVDALKMFDSIGTAETVENMLDYRFAKLLLSPWNGWSNPDEDEASCNDRFLPSPAIANDTSSTGPAHNPLLDDIVVLVETSTLESLNLGMGIRGTWVQLVRYDAVVEIGERHASSMTVPRRFWYLEELTTILPSYHVPLRD